MIFPVVREIILLVVTVEYAGCIPKIAGLLTLVEMFWRVLVGDLYYAHHEVVFHSGNIACCEKATETSSF